MSNKKAATPAPNFNVNQDHVDQIQKNLTVKSAMNTIKNYSQSNHRKKQISQLKKMINNSMNLCRKTLKSRLLNNRKKTKESSSQSDALLKNLKGKTSKWNHNVASYSQKVPPQLDPKVKARLEERFSQDFTPLTLDDNVLKKFDAHHLKNFYFTTDSKQSIQVSASQSI